MSPRLVFMVRMGVEQEVKADIDIALELFPDAVIFGADYDFRCASLHLYSCCRARRISASDRCCAPRRDVERAVQEVAKRLRRDVYLEAGKYWVLYQVSVSQ
eukprot:COSAG01_NODE_6181_length_3806_cov_2.435932_3_plen_102_part_00